MERIFAYARIHDLRMQDDYVIEKDKIYLRSVHGNKVEWFETYLKEAETDGQKGMIADSVLKLNLLYEDGVIKYYGSVGLGYARSTFDGGLQYHFVHLKKVKDKLVIFKMENKFMKCLKIM